MHQSVYTIFGTLSFIAFVVAIMISLRAYKSKGRGKRIFTSLHLFTLGIFVSTVLIFIPVYYTGYDFEDPYAFLRPLLVSIHHSLRVFILDGEFDTIRDAVSDTITVTHVLFSLHAAFLYVIAPVLTFSNVLSLFKNLKGEIRFAWHKKHPFYIFSELNERSVALAESVSEIKKKVKPIIVFTDVFEQDEEDDYELLLKVHDMNAICLKKDITRLNVKKKKGRIEFFLMGDDESENVAQAIKLTEENRDTDKRSIYLFSSRPSAGYIIDSVDKGCKTVNDSLVKAVKESPTSILYENGLKVMNYNIDDGFYLRRIDSIELLTRRVLMDKALIDPLFGSAVEKKEISILIIGLGEYGKQFMKVALWLYQIYGVMLEVNIIDSKSKEEIEKVLEQECPEIITKNRLSINGDASYSINIFGGKDCFTSDLDNLFKNQACLTQTQLAIVALGDDEKNIEVAVTLRKLFVSFSGVSNKDDQNKTEDSPLIYSIVYDDKKATSLSSSKNGKGLVNYRETPYHINFVGNLKSQFSYEVIEREKEFESLALGYHLDWVAKSRQLREYYENESLPEFRRDVDHYFEKKKEAYIKEKGTDEGWIRDWKDAYLFKCDNDGNPNYEEFNDIEVRKMIDDYFNFEYYRASSIAKAIHKSVIGSWEMLRNNGKRPKDHVDVPVCGCKYCTGRRITEHMRWNAYMRVNGYRYSKKRLDRAKLHDLLVPWGELDELERYKDESYFF